MGETRQEKKSLLAKLKHPLTYWILGWLALGVVLSVVLKLANIKTPYLADAWQVADFLILITIIYFAAKGPVKQYLVDRRKEIAESIETYRKMLEEMRKNYEEINYRLAWIEDEVEAIESRARADVALERMRLEQEAKKQIERIKNEAEFTAKQEIKAAEARLKEEAVARALKIAEDILRKKVTDKEELKLFEDYLREVGSGA